jgi:MtN3 and saliva related transmembrane protein
MELTEIVGHTGSVLSSITFIPQVWQAWKTKSVGDLNLTMMLIVATSCLVWLCYGVMNTPMLWPVIICNSIIFLLALLLIYFKFSFKKK